LTARSVLIVKVAAVGDAVMALPMLTALRALHPDAHVCWLCGRSIRPVLDLVPGIDETIEIDDTRLFSARRLDRVREVLRAWRSLAGRRFDLVLIGHRDRRFRLLTATVRRGEVRALGAGGRTGPIPGRSYRDEFVRLATQVDDWRAIHHAAPALRLRDTELARQLVGRASSRPLIALAPGGARNSARTSPLKRWPLDRYVELARRLLRDGFAVAIVGDAGDDWVRPAFAQSDVCDMIGKTSLADLPGVLARCAAVVTHDSAPLHLAALVGTPVVALFGPTDPAAFAPPGERVEVLWPGRALACAPCYDGRDFAACDDNRCMQMIDVESVHARIHALTGGHDTQEDSPRVATSVADGHDSRTDANRARS
jgi:lipopolysaccharide heptosyltransferase II